MKTLGKQMGLKQELPCEHAVRAVFPSIRSLVARILLNEMGINKYTISKVLGMTPAAVTFYIDGKRGDKYVKRIEESPELAGLTRKLARMLLDTYNERGFIEYHLYQIAMCSICSKVNEIAIEHGCLANTPLLKDKLVG